MLGFSSSYLDVSACIFLIAIWHAPIRANLKDSKFGDSPSEVSVYPAFLDGNYIKAFRKGKIEGDSPGPRFRDLHSPGRLGSCKAS